MSDLIPTTALGGAAPRTKTFGQLKLSENSNLALASLAKRRDAAQPTPFGMTLPGPGGLLAMQDTSAFWTGPDQWMVCAQGRAEEDFAAGLMAHAPGHWVTDQTDAWVVFDISATKGTLGRLLERLVNADADSTGQGTAIRTGLEHLNVFVLRPSDECVQILGMRSAAQSLWHALETAAARLAAGEQE